MHGKMRQILGSSHNEQVSEDVPSDGPIVPDIHAGPSASPLVLRKNVPLLLTLLGSIQGRAG